MNFKDFLKEKIITLLLIIFVIVTVEIFLMLYEVSMYIRIYIFVGIIVSYFIGIFIEYKRKKEFYNQTINSLKELEQKYLIAELTGTPDFIEGKILKNILQETNKSMLENVNYYKYLQEEYKDYIELWIHEIKLPIATSKMIVENNKNLIIKSIDEEMNKIENYIEQALFYARSNTVEKDFCVKKIQLKEIVNETIIKNKNILISKDIKIDIGNLEQVIYTDGKWCVFILSQIILNCIKYTKNLNSEIKIYKEEEKDKTILCIKDNGIGIKSGEIKNVFEKGFTGTNGRIIGKKSTGIGLYLCKKLCNKLGLGIELQSVENEWTEVKIIFPKNNFYNFKEEF